MMAEGSDVLKLLLLLTFSVHLSSADTHSLQYLYTGVPPGGNLPEFTAVGLLDGEQFMYYSSNNGTMIPKTEWIQKLKDYWGSEAERVQNHQDDLNTTLAKAVQSFNHAEGDHTLQRMYGCELYDDNTTRGYDQFGYDGEDFFSLNLTAGTWTADNDKAENFIQQWEAAGDQAEKSKDFLENKCIDQLKEFMSYGRETQERKVRPEASLFLKHSSSPKVVCHATGFFPKAVNITWQKDGEDVHEDVELRETLPNQDGSFQKRSILKVPAELQKPTYTCVTQHSSLEKELVLEVPKSEGSGGGSDGQ